MKTRLEMEVEAERWWLLAVHCASRSQLCQETAGLYPADTLAAENVSADAVWWEQRQAEFEVLAGWYQNAAKLMGEGKLPAGPPSDRLQAVEATEALLVNYPIYDAQPQLEYDT